MKTAEKLFNKIFSFFGDSVLIYTALIITSVMYYYNDKLTALWLIVSVLAVRILFLIFDYIAKHKISGSLIYLAIFFISMFAIRTAIRKGAESYPISFLLWFITTQDALDYSRWYTIAVYIFAIIFFSSVMYYFTKIRYRMSMGFLVFLIPFVIYGKESSQMPAYLIILLAIFFIINLICYNNIRNGDNSITLGKRNIIQSIAVYTLSFGILASVIPKPQINADRTYLESLINMDAFTDMLISRINVFNNEASSSKFNSLTTDDRIIYYARSEEPLRLKTQVFEDYNYSSDSWTFDYDDYSFADSYETRNPSEIIKLIVLCSELDTDFTKKYNINSTSETSDFEALKKELSLYAMDINPECLPVPSWLSDVETPQGIEKEFSNFGTVKSQQNSFPSHSSYKIEYYSDSFIYNPDVYNILASLSYDADNEIYSDMLEIFLKNNMDSEAETIRELIAESENASDNLDYGENQKIRNLALEITDGLSSDYEKALAIEKYFISNDFIYDLTYRKGNDENAETFLFETKRGVCYEYATAMVLLARASGIPARYAEGYNMNQNYGDSGENRSTPNYVIRIRDAHGFPELYITGIGWMSFEPTIADYIIDYEKADISKGIYISGIILTVALIVLLLIFKFYPSICHILFMIKIKRADPDKTVSLVFIRLREIFDCGRDVTAGELRDYLISKDKTDISLLQNLLEKSAYGNFKLNQTEKKDVIELYLSVYKSLKEKKKKSK